MHALHLETPLPPDLFDDARSTAAALLRQGRNFLTHGVRPLLDRPLIRHLFFAGATAALACAFGLGSAASLPDSLPSWGPDRAPGPQRSVSIGSSQADLPVVDLGTWLSRPGETQLEFVQRMGSVLRTFAHRTGLEACGTLWQQEGGRRWALPLTTNIAHAGCVATNLPVGPGWERSKDTVHVHPEQRVYRVNPNDALLLGLPATRGTGRSAIGHSEGDGFSQQDFQAGPGYVVAAGRLLHQNGARTVIDLGPIPLADAPPDALRTAELPAPEADDEGAVVEESTPAPARRRSRWRAGT